ncbi:MAG: ABC transporter ATP-binding protein [Verrucomicrobiota bacterium]
MRQLVLDVQNVGKRFGGLKAIDNICFQVGKGEILSVIGPNGAGKTTLFNCLSGFYQPDAGDVILSGERVNGMSPHQICRRGMARTFQNIRLFDHLSLVDNVLVGDTNHHSTSVWGMLIRSLSYRTFQQAAKERAMKWISFVGIEADPRSKAGHLSYGNQRRLEVARALATDPQVILLDEPGAGMNPSEIGGMIELIAKIRSQGITVVLIEHHMKVVMDISDRILVLDHGEELAIGKPEEIRNHPDVIEAYLGGSGEKRKVS